MVFRDKYGRFVKDNIPWNKGELEFIPMRY
jgi:hypothetical protein